MLPHRRDLANPITRESLEECSLATPEGDESKYESGDSARDLGGLTLNPKSQSPSVLWREPILHPRLITASSIIIAVVIDLGVYVVPGLARAGDILI